MFPFCQNISSGDVGVHVAFVLQASTRVLASTQEKVEKRKEEGGVYGTAGIQTRNEK